MHEAALVVDIVIDGRVDAAEALCVADIFKVEQEIFAPRELRVAADPVFADDVGAVELVPQHAVVEARGLLHQLARELLLIHHDAVGQEVNYVGSLFYSSNKSWQDGTVCVVLYCVYAVEWRVLYGK